MPEPSVRSQMQCNKIGRRNYSVRFPHWSDKLCTAKCKGESNGRNDPCKPDMAHSILVSSTSGNINSRAPYFVKTKEHSRRSFRECASINSEQHNEVSGLENFRKNSTLPGISKTTPHLIAGTRQKSTTQVIS